MIYLLAVVSFVGHATLAVLVINRVHATALPYWLLKICDALWYLFLLLVPVSWAMWIAPPPGIEIRWNVLQPICFTYLVLCNALAITLVPGWFRRAVKPRACLRLVSNHTSLLDVSRQLQHRPCGTALTRCLSYFPGNQIFQLQLHEKRLLLPRLRPELAGLSIAHLSDFHFTGQLTADFYHEIVRQANELDADLVAITGDIIDKRKCMDWLTDILGGLKSRYGVFFVLGNHDTRVHDHDAVRGALKSQGHLDLGGRWMQTEIKGCPLVLAGNELPWFVPAADLRDCPPAGRLDSPLRILLSHSPDQISWARVHDFDLMLAGHTHGGQIRLPILGPVVSPSRFGVKYASGTFYEPPTLMHVSRGISGTRQIRLNCPPEVTKLVLSAESSH